jgi:prepilin-type N-terminal cleavage/methylation domain-containing protein
MITRQIPVSGQRGFTIVELMTTVAVIGIISVGGFPLFTTFLRASETHGASRELATLLNQARQLAITRNADYRVDIEVDGNRLRFVDTATGATWTGPGTDAQGYRRLMNQARLTNRTANPTFNHLGTAGGGTITVRNSSSSSSLNVVVAPSGQIRIDRIE